MNDAEVFEILRRAICSIQETKAKPVRVAVNGIEGTGKTTFADTFTDYLNTSAMNAIHVSIDGFHHPRQIRYRQGRDSAHGYYEDSYNERAFVEKVLMSSQTVSPKITPAVHCLDSDQCLDITPQAIANDAILITDGAYLFKPIYRKLWDLKIYLKTDFNTALKRGVQRDAQMLGGEDAATQKFMLRYHAASRMYIEDNNPEELADIIIDNSDFKNMNIRKNRFHTHTPPLL